MDRTALRETVMPETDLPATAYQYHHRLLGSSSPDVPTGLLFDSQTFAFMSITYPPDSHTPDLNVDKDGDRVLVLVAGDLALQIGQQSFRLAPGDAVKIPRNVQFGNSHSRSGAHLLLIRAK